MILKAIYNFKIFQGFKVSSLVSRYFSGDTTAIFGSSLEDETWISSLNKVNSSLNNHKAFFPLFIKATIMVSNLTRRI